jgi:hypothetical protein
MSGKRSNLAAGHNNGTTKICAILGSFTDGGIDIVYRDLQMPMLNLDNIDLDCGDRIKVKKASGKRGKYVR